MPRYSPVAPIQILEQLQEGGLLDGYLLLLAQEVYKDPARYERLVFDLRNDWGEEDTFIIMDNGVVELGDPVPVNQLIEAANIVEADCVVLPDSLGNMAKTKKLVMDTSGLLSQDFRLMMVPQGNVYTEILCCIDWLAERLPTSGVPYLWGIPRLIANQMSTRSGVITYINQYYPHSEIHLLGMSRHLSDDIQCTRMPQVMGIDSASPLVKGHHGHPVADTPHMDRGNFWECTTLTHMMGTNVEWMHNALRT